MLAKPLNNRSSSNTGATTQFSTSPHSAVDRLLGTLRLLEAGKLNTDADHLHFESTDEEYIDFLRRLRTNKVLHGWFEEKFRYDWEPAEPKEKKRGRFVIRMPSKTHTFFVSRFVDGLVARVKDVAHLLGFEAEADDKKVSAVVTELSKVRRSGSVTLEMNPPALENITLESTKSSRNVKRTPDAMFYHSRSPALPQLVIEVSYSQQGRKDLARIAESYIVDSRHAIRCVIGVDIPYKQCKEKSKGRSTFEDKQATISVWRPDVERDEDGTEVGICKTYMDAVPFRNSNGTVDEGTLKLAAADFLPQLVISRLPSEAAEQTIEIPFADLAKYLETAEYDASFPSPTASFTAPRKFRKRKRTSSEETSEGLESRAK